MRAMQRFFITCRLHTKLSFNFQRQGDIYLDGISTTSVGCRNFNITELREKKGNGLKFREDLLSQFSAYKKHYFKYRWLQLMRKFDVATLSATDIYIQTDYGA